MPSRAPLVLWIWSRDSSVIFWETCTGTDSRFALSCSFHPTLVHLPSCLSLLLIVRTLSIFQSNLVNLDWLPLAQSARSSSPCKSESAHLDPSKTDREPSYSSSYSVRSTVLPHCNSTDWQRYWLTLPFCSLSPFLTLSSNDSFLPPLGVFLERGCVSLFPLDSCFLSSLWFLGEGGRVRGWRVLERGGSTSRSRLRSASVAVRAWGCGIVAGFLDSRFEGSLES